MCIKKQKRVMMLLSKVNDIGQKTTMIRMLSLQLITTQNV